VSCRTVLQPPDPESRGLIDESRGLIDESRGLVKKCGQVLRDLER
jgi:hypothetical protein